MTRNTKPKPRRLSSARIVRRAVCRPGPTPQAASHSFRMERYKTSRFWGVYDGPSQLICVCVYKKGAAEIVQRLSDNKSTRRGGLRCQAK